MTRAVPVVSQLNVYPIKSCHGIPVSEALVEPRGFRNDRRWMVVDSKSRFMTQREHPRLSLVHVKLLSNEIEISAPEMRPLRFPKDLDGDAATEVQVWRDKVSALSAGPEAQTWFTRFLGIESRLVYMPDRSIRFLNSDFAINRVQVSFADAFPFLLISEASLEDLNTRLHSPVPMNRFRPNIVVRGCRPFGEDSWKSFRVSSITFHAAKPCSRCVTTTVDQATGMRGKEPLATLSRYRNQDGKVLFGQNLVHEGTGMIRVGDSIEVFANLTTR